MCGCWCQFTEETGVAVTWSTDSFKDQLLDNMKHHTDRTSLACWRLDMLCWYQATMAVFLASPRAYCWGKLNSGQWWRSAKTIYHVVSVPPPWSCRLRGAYSYTNLGVSCWYIDPFPSMITLFVDGNSSFFPGVALSPPCPSRVCICRQIVCRQLPARLVTQTMESGSTF